MADWHHYGEGRITVVELQVLIQERTIFITPPSVCIYGYVREKKQCLSVSVSAL